MSQELRGVLGPATPGYIQAPTPLLVPFKHFYTAGGVRIQKYTHFLGFLRFLPFHGLHLGTKRVGKGGAESPNPSGEKGIHLVRLNTRGRKFKDSPRFLIFTLQCRPKWSKFKRKTMP